VPAARRRGLLGLHAAEQRSAAAPRRHPARGRRLRSRNKAPSPRWPLPTRTFCASPPPLRRTRRPGPGRDGSDQLARSEQAQGGG